MAVHSGQTAGKTAARGAKRRLAVATTIPVELVDELEVLISATDPDQHLRPDAARRMRLYLAELYASAAAAIPLPILMPAPDGGCQVAWESRSKKVIVLVSANEPTEPRAFSVDGADALQQIDLPTVEAHIQALIA